ncbi:tetratricopeptide repeat protein [Sphingopyxis macrogoltabida]|uniref:DUF1570 domain-containing protein n=1 Tax=Sphingopyxis macrogoltabida TaxID=33050 RepID=A0AAC9FG99_SPHMC|nr:hypothetical protein [Sphingopyxis macrogoltabida]ALJ15005.1 hypothetical protein LH19_19205 [Sphingopyxis macrogoltabida]AMU91253.1 hypothetical protein ATM17_19755 [Sphingopyxis macrogoltabida]
MRHWIAAVLAVLLTAALATPASARWLRADTNNFIIYSEGSEKSLRSFAENLQRFDATLRHRFNVPGGAEPNRLTIYLVERADEAGRLASGKSGSSIAGFYLAGSDGAFAVSNRENDEGRGTPAAQQTLFHEYAHHFMKRYVPAAFPAWFIEGFAEYVSTVDFSREGKASIGKPVYRRAYGLLEMPKIPVEQLITQRPDAMRSSGMADAYYGRSWLLTHMLYSDPNRQGQLLAYMQAINRGEEAVEAARKTFGDLGQLDKDLNRYLNRSLAYVALHEPMKVEGTIAIAPLAAAEDALIPLRLERLSAQYSPERMAAVRPALQKLTVAQPGDAGTWYELAAAEWGMDKDKRDLAAARAAVDKAIALQPDHVRANVLLGRLIAIGFDEKGDYSAGAWSAVRKPIMLANRTNPDDPIPLYAYFQTFGDQGFPPTGMALQGLEKAFVLEPENVSIRISQAFALANQGRFNEAIGLAESVAFDPHDRGQGQSLLDQLEAMRANREKTFIRTEGTEGVTD